MIATITQFLNKLLGIGFNKKKNIKIMIYTSVYQASQNLKSVLKDIINNSGFPIYLTVDGKTVILNEDNLKVEVGSEEDLEINVE